MYKIFWLFILSSRYIRPAAGLGISAQKYNPEVRVGHPDTAVYTYDNTLRDVKRVSLNATHKS